MSSKEQIAIIKNAMKQEKKRLQNLPKEQAKQEARESLIRIGVLDVLGKVSKNYARGFVNTQ